MLYGDLLLDDRNAKKRSKSGIRGFGMGEQLCEAFHTLNNNWGRCRGPSAKFVRFELHPYPCLGLLAIFKRPNKRLYLAVCILCFQSRVTLE